MTVYVANCKWLWRYPPEFKWEVQPGESSATCRASVGEKVVTVWLPSGARIRCQLDSGKKPTEQLFKSRYGESGDKLIEFTLELATDNQQ